MGAPRTRPRPVGLRSGAALDRAPTRGHVPRSGKADRLLEIPHPEARDRLFVLAPLSDIAPGLAPPGWGETVGSVRAQREGIEGDAAVRAIARWTGTGWGALADT